MSYFFSETSEHADAFYVDWLKNTNNKPKLSHRHRLFIKLLKQFVPDKKAKILDIGCGLGDLLFLMKKEGYKNIIGIDHSQIAVEVCRKRNLNVMKASLENLPFEIKNNKYDVIILGDVLEHIYVPAQVILQLRELLTKDGKLIISVPNAGWIMNGILLSFAPQLLWLSVMFASWTHIKFYTFSSLRKELEACGFDIKWLGGVEPDLVDISRMKIWAKVIFGVFNVFLKFSKFLVRFLPNLFSQHIITLVVKCSTINKEYLKRYDIYV
jgi:2-polyprenyl-3-methyl-5-hydroxy-6-metoxy-1,4-benzoquinol methylase